MALILFERSENYYVSIKIAKIVLGDYPSNSKGSILFEQGENYYVRMTAYGNSLPCIEWCRVLGH